MVIWERLDQGTASEKERQREPNQEGFLYLCKICPTYSQISLKDHKKYNKNSI